MSQLLTRALILLFLSAAPAVSQMPPGLPGRDSYAIRRIDPKAPCRFSAEYQKIQSHKTDPRVAYLEVEPLVIGDDDPIGFEARCRQISQQTEDGITFFDGARGYLHLIFGSPVINTEVVYFAGTGKDFGVMLYVSRWDDEWRAFALTWGNGKWVDVSKQYLVPLGLGKNDLILPPQYGRTIRVLTRQGDDFRHKRWLTWNGSQFITLDDKAGKSTWRCPDPYRYFEPADRALYCR